MCRQCIHTIKTYANHAHQLLLAMIYVSPCLYILYVYTYVKSRNYPLRLLPKSLRRAPTSANIKQGPYCKNNTSSAGL